MSGDLGSRSTGVVRVVGAHLPEVAMSAQHGRSIGKVKRHDKLHPRKRIIQPTHQQTLLSRRVGQILVQEQQVVAEIKIGLARIGGRQTYRRRDETRRFAESPPRHIQQALCASTGQSSMWAKKSLSRPPTLTYSSLRTINAAPEAQKHGNHHVILARIASTVSNMRPRQ